MLCSCGDDGRLRGWNWKELLNSDILSGTQGMNVCISDFVIPLTKTAIIFRKEKKGKGCNIY